MNDVRTTLERYSESLLRRVADCLVKPRNKLPTEELLERCLSTLDNAAVVDRRIRDLSHGAQASLIAVCRSHQSNWSVGQYITIAAASGHADGFQTVVELLTTGLILPTRTILPIPDFDAWFAAAGGLHAVCFIPESVRQRAAAIPFAWPVLNSTPWIQAAQTHDRLDIPLRLAALRQRVEAEAVRLTKTGTLYKKDQSRFDQDPVLAIPHVVDAGLLSLFWALAAGLLNRDGDILSPSPFPESWSQPIEVLTSDLFASSFTIDSWIPLVGATTESVVDRTAAPTAALLLVILLAAVPDDHGIAAGDLADWLWEHHPSWSSIIPSDSAQNRGQTWVHAFTTAITGPLGITETTNDLIRLTAFGRSVLNGGPIPDSAPLFPQALLVQPNGEILAYRQGLMPGLIRTLTRFAWWKAIGPACTLELSAEQVYRGLESGLTVAEILQTLQKHGSRAVPSSVEDLIRRWGSKRERVSVFTCATLVEFATADDLDKAISRGIVSIRLSDRVGLTADGSDPDYASLRLTGNRDYEARQQPCLKVDPNGMTWTVDTTFADLLLDVELQRVSQPILDESGAQRQAIADPVKIQTLISKSNGTEELEQWFMNRTGHPMPAVIRLFAQGSRNASPQLRTERFIRFADESTCDGVMQWPVTFNLIRERIGPTSVIIDEDRLEDVTTALKSIGIELT